MIPLKPAFSFAVCLPGASLGLGCLGMPVRPGRREARRGCRGTCRPPQGVLLGAPSPGRQRPGFSQRFVETGPLFGISMCTASVNSSLSLKREGGTGCSKFMCSMVYGCHISNGAEPDQLGGSACWGCGLGLGPGPRRTAVPGTVPSRDAEQGLWGHQAPVGPVVLMNSGSSPARGGLTPNCCSSPC